MLRYFGLVVLGGGLVAAYWFYVAWKHRPSPPPPPSTAKSSPKAIGIGARAVRQLDLLLNEPLLISNDKWRQESKNLVDEYYGTGEK